MLSPLKWVEHKENLKWQSRTNVYCLHLYITFFRPDFVAATLILIFHLRLGLEELKQILRKKKTFHLLL